MLRCAVIGCGWAGKHHLQTLEDNRETELVAAVEPDETLCRNIRRDFQIPVFSDVKQLLEGVPDIDIAVVATIPDLHKPVCITLIEKGIHIYCEKPVCRNSEDIRYLKELADAKGVRFGVAFNQRFGDAVLKAKEILEESCGSVHLVTASMYQHLPDKMSDNVREDFMLTDAVCHLLDVVTFLCGTVREVKAFGIKKESEIYSDIGAVFLLQDGGVGTISHSNVGGMIETQHPFQCIDIHTKECRMRIENQFDRLTVYPHSGKEQLVYETSVFLRRDYGVSMERALDAYLKAIKEGGELPSDITSALVNMQVIEEMKDSIQGRKMKGQV